MKQQQSVKTSAREVTKTRSGYTFRGAALRNLYAIAKARNVSPDEAFTRVVMEACERVKNPLNELPREIKIASLKYLMLSAKIAPKNRLGIYLSMIPKP